MNQMVSNKPPKRSTVLIWVGLFLLLFGLVFLSAGWFSIKTEQLYQLQGVTVPGTVTNKYIDETWDSKNKTKSKTYNIRYTFTPEGGTLIESKSSVGSVAYDDAFEGGQIDIQYIPSDVSQNRIAGESSLVFGIVFMSIGGLIGLVGLLLIRYEVKTRRLAARLYREGMMAEATIESVGPGNMSINNVQQWRIEYKFRDMKGIEQQGITPHMPPQDASEFKPGEKGKVRYDKNNSSINIWVGR